MTERPTGNAKGSGKGGGVGVRLLQLYGERCKERRFRPPPPVPPAAARGRVPAPPPPPGALPVARAGQHRRPGVLPPFPPWRCPAPRRPVWGSAGARLRPAFLRSLRGDERCPEREPPACPGSGFLAISLSPERQNSNSLVLGVFPWFHRDPYQGCGVQLQPNSS